MSYKNRMESMVTPRTGVSIETEDGRLTRGRSVPDSHPAVRANRAAFMRAPEGCEPLVKPEPVKKAKAKKAPKAAERFIIDGEASE